jgi:hypothetical protein
MFQALENMSAKPILPRGEKIWQLKKGAHGAAVISSPV